MYKVAYILKMAAGEPHTLLDDSYYSGIHNVGMHRFWDRIKGGIGEDGTPKRTWYGQTADWFQNLFTNTDEFKEADEKWYNEQVDAFLGDKNISEYEKMRIRDMRKSGYAGHDIAQLAKDIHYSYTSPDYKRKLLTNKDRWQGDRDEHALVTVGKHIGNLLGGDFKTEVDEERARLAKKDKAIGSDKVAIKYDTDRLKEREAAVRQAAAEARKERIQARFDQQAAAYRKFVEGLPPKKQEWRPGPKGTTTVTPNYNLFL